MMSSYVKVARIGVSSYIATRNIVFSACFLFCFLPVVDDKPCCELGDLFRVNSEDLLKAQHVLLSRVFLSGFMSSFVPRDYVAPLHVLLLRSSRRKSPLYRAETLPFELYSIMIGCPMVRYGMCHGFTTVTRWVTHIYRPCHVPWGSPWISPMDHFTV